MIRSGTVEPEGCYWVMGLFWVKRVLWGNRVALGYLSRAQRFGLSRVWDLGQKDSLKPGVKVRGFGIKFYGCAHLV